MNLVQTFDQAWACASLLHIPHDKQPNVFTNIAHLIKDSGTVYCSYKLGDKQRIFDGLLFEDYNLESFTQLQNDIGIFKIIEFWVSKDKINNQERPCWVNFILQKTL